MKVQRRHIRLAGRCERSNRRRIGKTAGDSKNVILLRDYEGYSYVEIGEILELTEAQVKVYIFRARQTLKNI